MEGPRDAYAQEVEQNHRSRKDHHIRNIGGRRQYCRDDENHNDRPSPYLEQNLVIYESEAGQEIGNSRDLKHNPKPEHYSQDQVEVIVGCELRPQLAVCSHSKEVVRRPRKRYIVGKRAAEKKEDRRHCHEWNCVPLFVLVQPGGNESPRLPQQEGDAQKQGRIERNLDVQVECAGRLKDNQLVVAVHLHRARAGQVLRNDEAWLYYAQAVYEPVIACHELRRIVRGCSFDLAVDTGSGWQQGIIAIDLCVSHKLKLHLLPVRQIAQGESVNVGQWDGHHLLGFHNSRPDRDFQEVVNLVRHKPAHHKCDYHEERRMHQPPAQFVQMLKEGHAPLLAGLSLSVVTLRVCCHVSTSLSQL